MYIHVHAKCECMFIYEDACNMQWVCGIAYTNIYVASYSYIYVYNCNLHIYIKTHDCVSVAKKYMRHTSVLLTGTTKSPFSTPCISIITRPISIKFTHFMLTIYTTLHTKFEVNQLSSF